MSRSTDPQLELAQIADEISQSLEDGRPVEWQGLIDRYPEFAQRLQAMRPALEGLVELGFSSGSPALTPMFDSPMSKRTLGDFRIIREIGRGGMGVVYEAEQVSLERSVALKILPFAATLDDRQLRRFKNEARAAAMLKHPSIVSAYSIGCHNGVHYYAMELIEGQSLAELIEEMRIAQQDIQRNSDSEYQRCDSANETTPLAALPTCRSRDRKTFFRNVARLGIQAAEALHHAHQEGVIHRDIKPSNLLVDHEGNLHIADFGLARIKTDGDLTMSGDVIGTLRYMSPEQAQGSSYVDQRTDVYSLGVVLYELLTGAPLIAGQTRQDILRAIIEREPVWPRRLDPSVPIDLETVVMRALAKDSAARYGNATELAHDLQRYLDFRPIHARRSTRIGRIVRWGRRNPVVSALGSLLAVAVLVMAILGPAMFLRESNLRQNEISLTSNLRAQTGKLTQQLYVSEIGVAAQAVRDGQFERASRILDRFVPTASDRDLRGFEWHLLRRACEESLPVCRLKPETPSWNHGGSARSIGFLKNDTRLAVAYWSRHVKVWDIRTRQVVHTFQTPNPISSMTCSSAAELIVALDETGHLFVWNATTGDLLQDESNLGRGERRTVSLSPDASLLAVPTGDDSVQLWARDDREGLSYCRQLELIHGAGVSASEFSVDGERLFTGTVDGTLTAWDIRSGQQLWNHRIHAGSVRCVRVSPNNRWIASCGDAGAVGLWHAANGELYRSLSGHTRIVDEMSFSPDGGVLTSVGLDGQALKWSVESGQAIGTIPNNVALYSVAYSADGELIAVGDTAGQLTIWKHDAFSRTPFALWDACFGLAIAPDSNSVVAASSQAMAMRAWTCPDGDTMWTADDPTKTGYYYSVAFSPRERLIACGTGISEIGEERTDAEGHFGSVHLRDAITGKLLGELSGHGELVTGVAFDSEGETLASCSTDGSVKLWNVRQQSELGFRPVPGAAHSFCVSFSPITRLLAIGTSEPAVELWKIGGASCELAGKLAGHDDWIVSTAFSPDGQLIVSASQDGTACVWDVSERKIIRVLRGHGDWVTGCDFSADGRTVVTVSQDDSLKLWNVSTGRELLTLRFIAGRTLPSVRFSSDGRWLAATCSRGLLRWTAARLDR